MELKRIRIKDGTHQNLGRLGRAVLDLLVVTVLIDELSRIEPLAFRSMILKRLQVLPPPDAGAGAVAGSPPPATGSGGAAVADPPSLATGSRSGTAEDSPSPDPGSRSRDAGEALPSRAGFRCPCVTATAGGNLVIDDAGRLRRRVDGCVKGSPGAVLAEGLSHYGAVGRGRDLNWFDVVYAGRLLKKWASGLRVPRVGRRLSWATIVRSDLAISVAPVCFAAHDPGPHPRVTGVHPIGRVAATDMCIQCSL